MIFLSLRSARHGVEICCAMRLCRSAASAASALSSSVGCENLNPSASAALEANATVVNISASTSCSRIEGSGDERKGTRGKQRRLADRSGEIHMKIRQNGSIAGSASPALRRLEHLARRAQARLERTLHPRMRERRRRAGCPHEYDASITAGPRETAGSFAFALSDG